MAMSKTTLHAAGVTVLGFVCFALASAAIGIPMWGYYDSLSGGYESDHGYFGPFKICKQLAYNREKCGSDVSKFRLSSSVYVSGLLATVGCFALGVFSVLSIIQIAMISSREKVVMSYTTLVIVKMILALTGCLLAIVATVLFSLQTDESEKYGYRTSRGISYYLQVVVIIFTLATFVVALYDVLFSRRPGGDPTMMSTACTPTTYNNPGFKDPNSRGISVSDASGEPYLGLYDDGGSVASLSTTITALSNGTTTTDAAAAAAVTRSPLRSSLKKPKTQRAGSKGIQNPGFSGAGNSPPLKRNGSVKKVRIQTHSTEV